MEMKQIYIILSTVALTACSNSEKYFDATGTFEATEVTVSSEQNGKLICLNISEGDRVEAGQEVGLTDTVQLYLQARQIGATKLIYATQRPDTEKQVAATRQQIAKAEQEFQRFNGLWQEGAANRKQVDDAKSQIDVLQKQLYAQLSTLQNSTKSLNAQMETANVQCLQVADQLRKCHITSPISGVVLSKYAEAGEFAVVGKPLFKVAELDNMFLRAYVTSAQLSNIKLGQDVKVYADFGAGDRKEYDGKIIWISAKSEFTPKTILTDDERADIVYAVKIAVKNDGYVKIGMYGEVKF